MPRVAVRVDRVAADGVAAHLRDPAVDAHAVGPVEGDDVAGAGCWHRRRCCSTTDRDVDAVDQLGSGVSVGGDADQVADDLRVGRTARARRRRRACRTGAGDEIAGAGASVPPILAPLAWNTCTPVPLFGTRGRAGRVGADVVALHDGVDRRDLDAGADVAGDRRCGPPASCRRSSRTVRDSSGCRTRRSCRRRSTRCR